MRFYYTGRSQRVVTLPNGTSLKVAPKSYFDAPEVVAKLLPGVVKVAGETGEEPKPGVVEPVVSHPVDAMPVVDQESTKSEPEPEVEPAATALDAVADAPKQGGDESSEAADAVEETTHGKRYRRRRS